MIINYMTFARSLMNIVTDLDDVFKFVMGHGLVITE